MLISIKKMINGMRLGLHLDLNTGEFISIPPTCLAGDRFKSFIHRPAYHPLCLEYYYDVEANRYHLIPAKFFEEGVLNSIVPLPDSNIGFVDLAKKFLIDVISKRYDDTETISKINRILDLNVQRDFCHEFDLFLAKGISNCLLWPEWNKFFEAEQTKRAIQWCEENGFEYLLDNVDA